MVGDLPGNEHFTYKYFLGYVSILFDVMELGLNKMDLHLHIQIKIKVFIRIYVVGAS